MTDQKPKPQGPPSPAAPAAPVAEQPRQDNQVVGGSAPKAPAAPSEPSMSPPENGPVDNGDPVVETPKPQFGAAPSDSEKEFKPVVSGIMVTAMRKGFYNNSRMPEGKRFKIRNADEWGSWMKCDDKALQAELEKKDRARKGLAKR